MPRRVLVWADGAYTRGFRQWAEMELGWRGGVSYHRARHLWRYRLVKLGKPAWLPGVASPMGRREDVRLAGAGAAVQQVLIAASRYQKHTIWTPPTFYQMVSVRSS